MIKTPKKKTTTEKTGAACHNRRAKVEIACDFCHRQFPFKKLIILDNEQQMCPDCEKRFKGYPSSHRVNPRRTLTTIDPDI